MITTYHNYDLTAANTFGLHARCRQFVSFTATGDLSEIAATVAREARPYVILGGGSNVLFVGNYEGTVIHCANSSIEIVDRDAHSVTVQLGAGAKLGDLVRWAAERGMWGVENLAGIPGSVGGAAVQNAGAYGCQMSDVVVAVKCCDLTKGELLLLSSPQSLGYGYRSSMFKRPENSGRYAIAEVMVRLHLEPHPCLTYGPLSQWPHPDPLTPAAIGAKVREIRDSKLPNPDVVGSAGSYFTNPVVSEEHYRKLLQSHPQMPAHATAEGMKLSAAWLIDHSMLAGHRSGNAQVWERQPLVIVNRGGATAQDVISLEREIVATVEQKMGVTLRPEVVKIQNP